MPETQESSAKHKILEILTSLCQWLIFSVLISLIPLGVRFLSMESTLDQASSGFLTVFSSNGDLLLISTVLVSEGVGEIITESKIPDLLKIISVGCSLLIVITACILFGLFLNGNPTTESELWLGKFLFWVSLLTSATCKLARTLFGK